MCHNSPGLPSTQRIPLRSTCLTRLVFASLPSPEFVVPPSLLIRVISFFNIIVVLVVALFFASNHRRVPLPAALPDSAFLKTLRFKRPQSYFIPSRYIFTFLPVSLLATLSLCPCLNPQTFLFPCSNISLTSPPWSFELLTFYNFPPTPPPFAVVPN